MEEASINVCNNKHLDPEHELSEDDTINNMLEYNNNNIESQWNYEAIFDICLHIPSSWVKIGWHTKKQIPGPPQSG